MSKEKAIQKCVNTLQDCKTGDIEKDHLKADQALVDLLIDLGINEVVEEYNKTEKWYS